MPTTFAFNFNERKVAPKLNKLSKCAKGIKRIDKNKTNSGQTFFLIVNTTHYFLHCRGAAINRIVPDFCLLRFQKRITYLCKNIINCVTTITIENKKIFLTFLH